MAAVGSTHYSGIGHQKRRVAKKWKLLGTISTATLTSSRGKTFRCSRSITEEGNHEDNEVRWSTTRLRKSDIEINKKEYGDGDLISYYTGSAYDTRSVCRSLSCLPATARSDPSQLSYTTWHYPWARRAHSRLGAHEVRRCVRRLAGPRDVLL